MARANVIIVGSGKLGSSIAKELCAKGENVLVIDREERKLAHLGDFSGFIVKGDATDMSLLEESGIKDAKHVVLTTNDDNTNLFLADVCNSIYHIPNIHVRLADSRKAVMCDYPAAKTICPFDLSINNFEENYGEKL